MDRQGISVTYYKGQTGGRALQYNAIARPSTLAIKSIAHRDRDTSSRYRGMTAAGATPVKHIANL